MKYLKSYQQLNEGVSDKVYHFTHINNVVDILKNDEIFLTAVFGTKSENEINRGKLYALSLTTSRHTGIGYASAQKRGGTFTNIVRLTMNGRALNQTFKSIPVYYWHTKGSEKRDDYIDVPSQVRILPSRDEQEDRIISDKDVIRKVKKYITAVEVINGDAETLSKVKTLAKKRGIPFYAYDEVKYFDASAKKYAIKVEEYSDVIAVSKQEKLYTRDFTELFAFLVYRDDKLADKMFKELAKKDLSQLNKTNPPTLDIIKAEVQESINKLKGWIYYPNDLTIRDAASSLSATISTGSTRKSTNKLMRWLLQQFGLDMKRNGAKTTKDYIEYKIWKDRKTQTIFNNELWEKTQIMLDTTFKKVLADNLYQDYYLKNGDWYEHIRDYKPVIKFLEGKMDLIRAYLKDTILNNSDMYKSIYELSNSGIQREIGYDRYDNDYEEYKEPLKDVDDEKELYRNVADIVRLWFYDIQEFFDTNLPSMKDEMMNQWKNN